MLTNATATTYMRLRPPRRIVRRINQRVKWLYLPFRVWRHDRRSRDRQIRVIRVCRHNASSISNQKPCNSRFAHRDVRQVPWRSLQI